MENNQRSPLTLRPLKANESDLFYSATPNVDKTLGTVGHIRGYFEKGTRQFHSKWTPHNDDALNTSEFKAELHEIMDGWRNNGPLEDLESMQEYCHEHGEGVIEGYAYGFIAESENFRYCLRCTPRPGEYHAYLYVYDKRQQAMHQVQSGPQLTHMKLFMPLHCDVYERDAYGVLEEYPYEMGGLGALAYAEEIAAAIEAHKLPEEIQRGLMHWYGEGDSVDEKVHSAVFSVEAHADTLWGVALCALRGELKDSELTTLKDYLTGQAADGWGEGFEQRDIEVGDGSILNVHLWDSGNDWQMMTEDELNRKLRQDQSPQMEDLT